MKVLRIKFTDFWFGFSPSNNYFFNLLSKHFLIELSENPEIIFYSCYGRAYLKYKCIRIFYTADNLRPDFTGCDFAISFDFNNNDRHFRLPLYVLYIDQYNSLSNLMAPKNKQEMLQIWRSKKKFCCMVVSNSKSKKRLQFFNKLCQYKKVDSGGKALNNIGGEVKDKINFIKEYRFVFAFENSSYPGYTTEKILEPLIVNSIPLYSGNPLIHIDFNVAAFLNLDDYKSEEEFIREIIAIDNNEEMAVKMLMEPKFKIGEIPCNFEKNGLLNFLRKIILTKDIFQPVGKSNKRYMHAFNLKKNYYGNRLREVLRSLLN